MQMAGKNLFHIKNTTDEAMRIQTIQICIHQFMGCNFRLFDGNPVGAKESNCSREQKIR